MVGLELGGTRAEYICQSLQYCGNFFHDIVVSGEVHGRYMVGGLMGSNGYSLSYYRSSGLSTKIDSVVVNGLVSGLDKVGGIIGYDGGGVLDRSYFSGEVDGKGLVGGLIGERLALDWKN